MAKSLNNESARPYPPFGCITPCRIHWRPSNRWASFFNHRFYLSRGLSADAQPATFGFQPGIQLRATASSSDHRTHWRFLPHVHPGWPMVARRAHVDRLVWRVPDRDDVAVSPENRRPVVANSGRTLLPAARTSQMRPARSRPGLHLSEYLSTLVRSYWRRDAHGRGRRSGRDAGRTISREGPIPGLVSRTSKPVHRHHDERTAAVRRRRLAGKRRRAESGEQRARSTLRHFARRTAFSCCDASPSRTA